MQRSSWLTVDDDEDGGHTYGASHISVGEDDHHELAQPSEQQPLLFTGSRDDGANETTPPHVGEGRRGWQSFLFPFSRSGVSRTVAAAGASTTSDGGGDGTATTAAARDGAESSPASIPADDSPSRSLSAALAQVRDRVARAVRPASARPSSLEREASQSQGEESPVQNTLRARWGAAMSRLGLQDSVDGGGGDGILGASFFDFGAFPDDAEAAGEGEGGGEDGVTLMASSFFRFSDSEDDLGDRGADGDVDRRPSGAPAGERQGLLSMEQQSLAMTPSGGGWGGSGRRGRSRRASRRRAQLASFALLFINFIFVVAAVTLLMAGVATGTSSVVRLCTPCRRLGNTVLVLGSLLLFCSLWGFLCLRQRALLCLLAYAALVVLLLFGLTIVMILAVVFDREARFPTTTDPGYMLEMWERAVNETYARHEEGGEQSGGMDPAFSDTSDSESATVAPSAPMKGASQEFMAHVVLPDGQPWSVSEEPAVCRAQREFQCSGFHYGCCRPGVCYELLPEDDPSAEDQHQGALEGGDPRTEPWATWKATSPSSSSFVSVSSSASRSSYTSSQSGPRLVPPAWVRKVCPRCPNADPDTYAAVVCTEEVYTTVRRNMAAFLLLGTYAWGLMLGGCLLAWLARRAARLRGKRRQQRALAAMATSGTTSH